VLHPDGTTTAYGPTGKCCTATHRPPLRAG
jgi:hypothetical protein